MKTASSITFTILHNRTVHPVDKLCVRLQDTVATTVFYNYIYTLDLRHWETPIKIIPQLRNNLSYHIIQYDIQPKGSPRLKNKSVTDVQVPELIMHCAP